MTWNYRIVKRLDGSFAVHEVYYNKDGEECMMTEDPILTFVAISNHEDEVLNEDENDVKKVIDMIHKDIHRAPVFEEPEVWAIDDYDAKDGP